jgi:transposase
MRVRASPGRLNRPGLPEAVWFESRCQFLLIEHGVVALLGLGRRDVVDRHQPAAVEPVDPFQRRELNGFERPPRPTPMDDLGLVKSVDGLGQSSRSCRRRCYGARIWEQVSRSLGVTAATLTSWRDAFLAAGEAVLRTKPATGEDLESDRLKARLGAALIERDLLEEKIAILEANRRLGRRRLRP